MNSNSETEDQEKKPDGMKEIKIIYDMIAKKIHNMNHLDQDEPYNAYILQNIFAYGNKNKLRKLNKNQLIIINSFHKIFLHTIGVYQFYGLYNFDLFKRKAKSYIYKYIYMKYIVI